MASSYILLVAITLNCHCLYSGASQSVCSRGTMLHTTKEGLAECVPCEDWTFMDEDNHSHTACKTCMFMEDPDVEVFVRRCNKTHDTVILCTSGFYRRRARHGGEVDMCEECTQCAHPYQACQDYNDTVCCNPNQDTVMTSSGLFVCQERPVVCRPGQFFSTSTEECFTCPAETFMSAHNHTYKDCLKCEQLSENNANHAIITRPCSRTAPTLFGCEDGYFRDPTQESSQKEVPCTPCRSCDWSLVDCGMFHDAVCDDKEEITVAIGSTSGDENEHGKQSLEISTENDNVTWGVFEPTSQTNKISAELPSCIGYLKTRDVGICVSIFAIVLLLSIGLLLFILLKLRQCNLTPSHVNIYAGCNLFCVKHIHNRHLSAMAGLSCLLVASLVTLGVTKTTDEQEVAAVSIVIILLTFVIIDFLIIYIIFRNLIKKVTYK